jgi:site-specific DNA recombinase
VIVREMTSRVLLGESLQSLTRDINRRGVKTSTGRPWTPTELRRLITRHRNAGLVEHQGQEVAEAQWPPIVDRDTWRAARSLLTDPSRRTPRYKGERFLGSGLYLCGVCGDGTTMLTATTMGSGHQRRPSYRCRRGPHLTRMAEAVDELVTAVAIERLSRPDARLLMYPEKAVDVAALQSRSLALRERLDELGGMFGSGIIDARQLSTGTTTIRAQLDQVTNDLAAVAAGSPLAGFLAADNVREVWDAAPTTRRKAVIRALMTVTLLKAPRGRQPDGSYFNPDYVKIEWKAEAS